MTFENDIYINLGKNIRKYRTERGLSQEKLSEMLDANLKFIGHVERVF
ncbi:MAG: multiprotein-bridging factor 1 family protein [Candidatus Avigastranaerophilus sp.]